MQPQAIECTNGNTYTALSSVTSPVGMVWHRLQEYQYLMSKISQYSNASLLKNIRGLSILYDHYITDSDKIISSSIDSKLLSYCTRVFLLQKWHFELLSITENILLLDTQWYINLLMHRYFIYSINTHIETLCINASQYRSISSHQRLHSFLCSSQS